MKLGQAVLINNSMSPDCQKTICSDNMENKYNNNIFHMFIFN